MKMKIKNAFTTVELVIVLTLIGFLAIFVISSLTGGSPDKNKMLFKKTYSVIEKTVQELVNDETLYPYNPNKLGFINNIKVQIPGEAENTDVEGDKKFATLFMDKLNINKVEPDGDPATNPTAKFTTSDGIYWEIPVKPFERGKDKTNGVTITVDVNGNSEGPNLLASQHPDDPKADKFEIHVLFDGKVLVDGAVEKAFLQSHDLKKDN